MLRKLTLAIIMTMLLLANMFVAVALNNAGFDNAEGVSSAKHGEFFYPLDSLWELDGKESSFSSYSGSVDYRSFMVADEDSVQLVIGVDYKETWSFGVFLRTLQSFKAAIVNAVSIKDRVIALVVDVPLEVASSFRTQISQNSFARYVEPNLKRRALFEPNDPYWSLQWGPQRIKANWAWNTTQGSPEIIVAVVDTGIDYTHPDLKDNYLGGYDWINDDNDPRDDFGHGTHCVGIIAAITNNILGIAGLAQVKIVAEKVLDEQGSGTDVSVAQGIIHAVGLGAKIISMSLGGYGYSRLLHEAVKYAYESGVLLVAAAGNDGLSSKVYPAAYEEVIAVAATDPNDKRAVFSNWGAWIELAAPGVAIFSTMPTYHVTLNDWGFTMDYSYMDGTSMACPHVAGVAALLWSIYPHATTDWLRAQLRHTADDLGASGFDKFFGYGRVNAWNAIGQVPSEHDLFIFDLDKPEYVKLGDTVIVNVTVLNFGLNTESSIEVCLLVNSTIVDSAVIDSINGLASAIVSLSWSPFEVGWYNVTYYVVPVSDEVDVENNQVAELVYVVLPPSEEKWAPLETDPNEGFGCDLKAVYGQAYCDVIYFKVEFYMKFETVSDLDAAILVDADQDPSTGLPDGTYPSQNTGIGADYLIIVGWEATEMWKWDSETRRWEIFNPFPLAYLEASENSNTFIVGVFFADIETSGIIDCVVCDVMSNWDWMPDSWHFTWMPIQFERDLAVILKTPMFLPPEETATLNATVCNYGLYDETDVEIHLLINDSLVASQTIAELAGGECYSFLYDWTPVEEGTYNITAYVSPKENENFTLNNKVTRIVKVYYPLINPNPGDKANYVIYHYDSSGRVISREYLNISYDYYVAPYKIFITVWETDQYGNTYMGYMIVNTMTRIVEEGIWQDLWYPGWIETNVGIGSTVNILDGEGVVTGEKMLVTGPKAVDCWEIQYSSYGYSYTFWYDKVSGLWIGMETGKPFTGERTVLRLMETNVAIGVQYEHDLGITLEAPFILQPGESSLINVTVYNLGVYDELEIKVQLMVNETVVLNETIDSLKNGEFFRLGHLWTPLDEGVYNITACVQPVSGEDVIVNNVANVLVPVEHFFVIYVRPSSASPGMQVTVRGHGATAFGAVLIFWDEMFVGDTWTDDFGNFEYMLTVPLDTVIGVHQITAIDRESGRAASAPFKVILITLNPSKATVGAKATVTGFGFTPGTSVRITFNDMFVGYAPVDYEGSFVFTFNIPLSTAGIQMIKAWDIDGYAVAFFTVIEAVELTVHVDVGTIHFRGEVAEFYVQTLLRGQSINVTDLNATLYGPNGKIAFYAYPTNITAVTIGLYKIAYTIPGNATTGTYPLVVNAEYTNETIQASGASFKCFMISGTLTAINAQITEIKDGIATVIIPELGLLKVNLKEINATLDKIFVKATAVNGTLVSVQTTLGRVQGVMTGIEGNLTTLVVPELGKVKVSLASLNVTLQQIFVKVEAINGTVATLQTILGKVNGTVREIKGNMATVVVPGLGQVQTDVSNLIGKQETWTIPQYLAMAFSLVAAAGAILSAGLLLKQKKFTKT